MRPTRRLWATITLAVTIAFLAVVFARPFVLTGTAVIGAWVLSRQYRFYRTLERTIRTLSVTQSPAQTGIRTGESVPVTLEVALESDSPQTLSVTAGLPTGATANVPLEVSLEPPDSRVDRTADVTWPIAGRHRFDEATVMATDGLFRETISVGSTPTVTVEPRSPRAIHVGSGGDRIASYGEHEGGQFGSGIEFADIREYVPGDAAKYIDWKATARRAYPHVREYETETDRRTLLLVDHRSSLATGPRGETKLDYLREVALATMASSRRLDDPLGLRTVGDDGVTHLFESSTTSDTYTEIRQCLLELEPTQSDEVAFGFSSPLTNDVSSSASPVPTDLLAESPFRHRSRTTLADVRRALATLEGADDAFAEVVGPFYDDRLIYQERVETDPLYEAVKRAHSRRSGTIWTVIFTDDTHPGELREALTLARQFGNEVLVMIAPTVLYELDGLADVERAYDRYVAFEELRREFDRIEGVTALEVGPKDRLSTVLSAGRAEGRGGRA